MIFTKRYRYRWGDMDEAGIAYYPSFFQYFHCCFEDWWSDALGVPYPQLAREENQGFPTVRVECDFLSPIRYGDEPDIHLAILRLGTSSIEFAYWMTAPDGVDPLCRARITTVAVDKRTMKKQTLPDRWRAAFEPYLIDEKEFPTGNDSHSKSRGK